jgi:arsenical pump membrane protein
LGVIGSGDGRHNRAQSRETVRFMTLHFVAVWAIAIGSIVLMLVRPWRSSEVLWVAIGALALVASGLVSVSRATSAVRKGVDVYLFLSGMMVLAEIARHSGVFDWVADIATRAAKGSSARLFLLIYLVGILVTAFLSNDATAVVLTPAVLAAVRRAEVQPRPHLLACAFIANAASFILPISNPANLVVYGPHLPPLFDWVHIFWLPSIVAVASTFICLRFLEQVELRSEVPHDHVPISLSSEGRIALAALLLATAILLTASARGVQLGAPTCIAAGVALLIMAVRDSRIFPAVMKGVTWSVVPLVGGLFVIVEGLNGAGLLEFARSALAHTSAARPAIARLGSGFAVSLLSNVMNNLPVGLASGAALQQNGGYAPLAHAVLLGVDLGPNLSVTGSLATILWLIALRREKVEITAGEFFRAGVIVMPVALLLAILTCWN